MRIWFSYLVTASFVSIYKTDYTGVCIQFMELNHFLQAPQITAVIVANILLPLLPFPSSPVSELSSQSTFRETLNNNNGKRIRIEKGLFCTDHNPTGNNINGNRQRRTEQTAAVA